MSSLPGLRPRRGSKLPRSDIDRVEIAKYAAEQIMHTNRVGAGGVYPTQNPVELLADQVARCRNMFHADGRFRTWPGDAQRGSVAGVNHIMGIFNLLSEGTAQDNIFFDRLNSYRWNAGTPDWEAIYELYTENTVDQIQIDTPVADQTQVDATGAAAWDSRDTTTGTVIQVGDDFKLDADPVGHFLPVLSISSDTRIILDGNYLGGDSGPALAGAYTIRKHFTGSQEEFFAFVEFQLKGYLSNGADTLKEWDPGAPSDRLNSVVDGTTPTNVPAARVLEPFERRIFAAKLAQYARTVETAQTIAWCADSDQADWTGAGSGFRNFIETPGAVQQLKRMDQNIVLYKEFDIWWGVGTSRLDPVVWEPKITAAQLGLLAYRSVVPIRGAGHLYLGQDDFYMLTPFQARPVGNSSIRDFLFSQIDRTVTARVQGVLLDQFQVAAFLVPFGSSGVGTPRVVLYDYVTDVWYGPLELGVTRLVYSIGNFFEPTSESTTIDQLVGTIDAQTFRLGGTIGGAGPKTVLLGDTAGQVNEVDERVDTYEGESRGPVYRTGQVYVGGTLSQYTGRIGGGEMQEGIVTRFTLIYRQPETLPAPQVVVSLSDDDFRTILATDVQDLENSKPGAISKAYFDFPGVGAERIAAEVSVASVASQLEILDHAIEKLPGGVEMNIS